MTDDFTPVEFSWSWDIGQGPPKIRLSVEAIGQDAGSELDPFNQTMTDELIGRIDSAVPGVDWELFHNFRAAFHQWDCAPFTLADAVDPSLSHTSSVFMGFELQNAEVAVKAYFVPVKAEQTGRSRMSILSESINSLQGSNLRLPSYDYLTDFLTNRSANSQLEIIGVAVDCVSLIHSRLKIYVRSSETSFDSVCEFMSLGGKLDTFTGDALQDFSQLWYAVLDIDEELATSEELHSRHHQTEGVLYNFDIKAGSTMPEAKVYIPVRHYAPNDKVVAHGLASYLKMKKEGRFVNDYLKALEGMCTHRPLANSCGLQTYISCAVKSGQLALTSYMSPEIYHGARW